MSDQHNEDSAGSKASEMMDHPVAQSRIIGKSRMIRTNDPKKVTYAQSLEVINAVEQHLKRYQITRKKLARSIGSSPAVISSVMNSTYKGDWQSVILLLDQWLEDELKREVVPKPKAFVWTHVAKDIQAVANVAVQLKSIGLVYGESGIGKTLALRAIAAEKAASCLCSMETVKVTPKGVLMAILEGLGQKRMPPMSRSAHALFDLVREQIQGTSRLIIIDQIHKLCTGSTDQALFTLTDLQDATGVPMLWCGTIDVRQYLQRRERGGREPLAQIRRRIAICHDLHDRTRGEDGDPGEQLFTVEEIRKVFARDKVKLTRDAARFLAQLANLPGEGHLGDCKNLLLVAQMTHAGEDVVTVEMLEASQALLMSRRVCDDLAFRMDEQANGLQLAAG